MKGKLVRWNEDRGFGFIKSSDISEDIFIHVSALKTMSRRPLVGDVIYFKVLTDKAGKNKAVNAKIQGVSAKTTQSTKSRKSNLLPTLFIIILLISACFYVYKTRSTLPNIISKTYNSIVTEEDFTGYSCQGKQYCNQMNSCKEARCTILSEKLSECKN